MEERQPDEVEAQENEIETEEVDLNKVFGGSGIDLNGMFPDHETRKFLCQVNRNRRSNERFLEGFNREKAWEEDG
jgi:hypothetical protein